MTNNYNKIRCYLPIFTVVSISVLVYLSALSNGFIWDDMVLIFENEGIKNWNRLYENFIRDFFDTTDDTLEFKYGYYRPVISFSYMIDYAVWGLKPWGFHLSNIIFHTICCVLVYLIFSFKPVFPASFSSPFIKSRIIRGGNSLLNAYTAVIASLLFACHPVHTESVTWISGRTDIVAGMFFFASFYLYQKALNSHFSRTETFGWFIRHGKGFYSCSVVLFAVAMLCKEMAATMPLLVIAYIFYGTGRQDKWRLRTSLILSMPYFLILLLYGVIRFIILGISTVNNPGGEEMEGFYPTALSFIKAVLIYLFKLAYPVNLNAYIQNPMSFSITESGVILSLLGVVAMVFLIVWLWKRWTNVSFMILLYLITLLPLSNFIRISAPWDMGFVMAERFLYIPSVGFCGLVAVLLTRISKIGRHLSLASMYTVVLLLIIILGCYSARTLLRNRDWMDEKTFFLKILKQTPDAALLHHALGNVYIREENYDMALVCYEKSLELYPAYHASYNNMGTIYSKKGLLDQAITAFKKAMKINPGYIQAHFNLGTVYYQKGMTEDAAIEFKRVLGINRNYVKAHNNLGIIYAEYGQLNNAIAEFEEVLKRDPDNEKAISNLAIIREELASKSSDKNADANIK